MTKRYEDHAKKIVDHFRDLLSQGARDAIDDDHLNQLTLLIESAISTAVVEELELAADQISLAATRLRQRAEQFD